MPDAAPTPTLTPTIPPVDAAPAAAPTTPAVPVVRLYPITLIDPKRRALAISIIDTLTGMVWSPGKSAFLPTPEDALIPMTSLAGPNHDQVRVLCLANGPDPVNARRYAFLAHDQAGGPPVTDPFPLTMVASDAPVFFAASVVPLR